MYQGRIIFEIFRTFMYLSYIYLFHILNYSCFFLGFLNRRKKCDEKALLIATNLSNLTSICCVYKEKIVKND